MGSIIRGFSQAVPVRVCTNFDLEKIVETTDQWIYERTGIKERRLLSDGESALSLALQAAAQTLKKTSLQAGDIEGIIAATSTPDNLLPNLSAQLATELDIHAWAFDLQAACSGFVHALKMARSVVESGQARRVLVVGLDIMSRAVDWGDRSTCVLFGDGAGCCVVEASETHGILATHAATLPDREMILRADNLITKPSSKGRLEMNGQAVFKKAIVTLSQTIFKLLEIASLDPSEIDWVVPHQANMRILQAVAERTPIPFDKYYCCVERYGNTSAGSIPIALGEACERGVFKPGDKILVVAFGAGLAYGGSIFVYQGS